MPLFDLSRTLELRNSLAGSQQPIQGKCSEAEFARDCSSVAKNDPIPYTFWKPETHLCIKRLKNYNFYSSEQQIINTYSYPAKHCGFQKDHQIDLISAIDCPVTTLINSSNLTNLLREIGFSFEREDHYPIVDFKIAEDQFC